MMARVTDEDRARLGHLLVPRDRRAREATAALQPPTAAPSQPSGGLPVPTADGRRWALALSTGERVVVEQTLVIGRDPQGLGQADAAGGVLAISELELSRTHARIVRGGRGLVVIDLGSTNGTAVVADGQRVTCSPGVPVPVPAGAVVDFAEGVVTAVVEVLPG